MERAMSIYELLLLATPSIFLIVMLTYELTYPDEKRHEVPDDWEA